MVPPAARTITSNHPDKVRMLVLETDEPHPDTQEEKGSFGDILNELLVKAGEAHSPRLAIETSMQYIVEPEGGQIPDKSEITDDVHAILITGSEWDAHGDDAWIHKLMDLIRRISLQPPKHVYILKLTLLSDIWIHRPDIRFTGICFGHQILCRTLGSKVAPEANRQWELSHSPIILSDVGRKLFNLPQREDRIHLHQMHLDHVVYPPSSETTDLLEKGTQVHVWGTSEHTGVQGVYIQKRLFSTQGHMEFNEVMVKRQLEMRVEAGSLRKEEANEASERADWMHDGEVVAKAVIRFFHGDDDEVE